MSTTLEFLTLAEVSEKLKLHSLTIRRAVAAGKFPSPLPGFRRLRWSAIAIEKWLLNQAAAVEQTASGRRGRPRGGEK
jgi:excisionase family DNA binding protein